MDDEHEQRALAEVRNRLCEQFPELDATVVEAAVRVSHAGLTESPIRDFVPVLVEHAARDRLAFAQRERDAEDALSAQASAPGEQDGEP